MIYECSNNPKYNEYMDFAEIRRDGAIVKVEEIQDFLVSQKTPSGKAYRSMRIIAEYDVEENLRRTIQKVACSEPMGGGEVVAFDERDSEWSVIAPGSSSDDKLKILEKAKLMGF